MSVPPWFRPAHHLLVSFLLVTMLPAAALFWLSWRSLEQDRLLETQRVRERCEQAADLLVIPNPHNSHIDSGHGSL